MTTEDQTRAGVRIDVHIRPAGFRDVRNIRQLYATLGRPSRGRIKCSEYFVAIEERAMIGCAAVRLIAEGGYLYGLAVERKSQRRGVGSALTLARIQRIRENRGRLAVVLAMFWNVRFFTALGFRLTRRSAMAPSVRRLADFCDPTFKRSATLLKLLDDSTM